MVSTYTSPPIESPTAGKAPAIRRVLVVDDSSLSRRVTLRLLKDNGYQAKAVNNGREAVKIHNGLDLTSNPLSRGNLRPQF